MTPRKLLSWAFSISAIFWIVLMIFHVGQEVYTRQFPILERLLDTNHAVIASFFIVAVSASIATFIIFLFGGTRGAIEFNALGVKIKGPSGPIVLWCIAFLVIMAGIVALAKT
jgi:hypothetical protein